MKNSPESVWKEFILSFEKCLNELNEDGTLSKKLFNKPEMTRFYKEDLFQRIAANLKLELSEKEYLRIDISLFKKGEENGWAVPIIFVESENDSVGDLPNEIHKLLSVNSPLKILMTRVSLKTELGSKFEENENTHWYYQLQDFAAADRLVGYFAVMSAEWEDDKLCYYYIVYNERNERIGEIQKLSLTK